MPGTQPKVTFDLFGKKRKSICGLLEQIKESGEPAVIPDILYLIFSNDNAISLAAGDSTRPKVSIETLF
jgi:hypothetical protein